MSKEIAIARLVGERKKWRKEKLAGFFAKPVPKREEKGLDMFTWICGIPGKKGGLWEGATLRMYMFFDADYPSKPPKCQFDPPLYHPNVYPTGSICLSILNPEEAWRPTITIKEILQGVSLLLDEPNEHSPAQGPAYSDYVRELAKYNAKVRDIVRKNQSTQFTDTVKSIIKTGQYRSKPLGPKELSERLRLERMGGGIDMALRRARDSSVDVIDLVDDLAPPRQRTRYQ
eukprot:gnl/Dysnectes_brevis/1565_a1775_2725.p1 GENE.gnl/Dysnectes_brevis/1565_a1775_2725~~gnl/Dysnectes_brevis/1565_a1775_2725.p1  ORF type:complete len:230 (-),score=44.91 gnl/Dysnectes_brevis/1565_a1775_2725:50-739(-)